MRRKSVFFLVFVLGALLVWPRGAHAQSRDEREIRAVLDRSVAAANSVDPKVVLECLADFDAGGGPYYLTFTSSVGSSAEVENGVRDQLMQISARTFALTSPATLHVEEHMAWTAYTWHSDISYKDGSHSSFDGRTTETFVREGKNWKIAHAHDSLVAPPSLTASERDAEGRKIVQLERSTWEALVKKQLPVLDRYFADDVSMFEEDQAYRVRGKAEALHRTETWLEDTTLENYQMLDPQAQVLGDTALLSYYFTASGVSEGKEFSTSGKVSAVFVKQNGAWRVLQTHRSVNR